MIADCRVAALLAMTPVASNGANQTPGTGTGAKQDCRAALAMTTSQEKETRAINRGTKKKPCNKLQG